MLVALALLPAWSPLAQASLSDLPIEQLMQMEVQSASRFRQEASTPRCRIPWSLPTRFAPMATGRSVTSSVRCIGVYTSLRSLRHLCGCARFRPRQATHNTRILLLIDGIRQNDAVFNQAMVGTESPLDIDPTSASSSFPARVLPSAWLECDLRVINVITKNSSAYRGGRSRRCRGQLQNSQRPADLRRCQRKRRGLDDFRLELLPARAEPRLPGHGAVHTTSTATAASRCSRNCRRTASA